MSFASDAAQSVIDDTYVEFGHSATYTPPGGSPGDPITIIVDLRDEGSRPDDGRPIAGQVTIEVRVTELALPAQSGIFTFTEASFGGRQVTVMNRPMLDEEEGLVWKMWAT